MNILCLEQGDWMGPAKYPDVKNDWELRLFGDFAFSRTNTVRSPIATTMKCLPLTISAQERRERPPA